MTGSRRTLNVVNRLSRQQTRIRRLETRVRPTSPEGQRPTIARAGRNSPQFQCDRPRQRRGLRVVRRGAPLASRLTERTNTRRCRMLTEDQAETIACVAAPASHNGAPIEPIDTHASIVFVAGTRA